METSRTAAGFLDGQTVKNKHGRAYAHILFAQHFCAPSAQQFLFEHQKNPVSAPTPRNKFGQSPQQSDKRTPRRVDRRNRVTNLECNHVSRKCEVV